MRINVKQLILNFQIERSPWLVNKFAIGIYPCSWTYYFAGVHAIVNSYFYFLSYITLNPNIYFIDNKYSTAYAQFYC